jgi:hypothetical protein
VISYLEAEMFLGQTRRKAGTQSHRPESRKRHGSGVADVDADRICWLISDQH